MYPITVKIERVFPIERRNGRGGKCSEFGFATATSRHYSLTLPGWPAIEAGMEVTAILEREGDWATLRGWVNHTSGEVVSPSRGDWIFHLVAALLLTGWVSIAWGQLGPLLFYLLYAMPCAWMLRQACRVKTALEAVLENRAPAS